MPRLFGENTDFLTQEKGPTGGSVADEGVAPPSNPIHTFKSRTRLAVVRQAVHPELFSDRTTGSGRGMPSYRAWVCGHEAG